MNSWLGFNLTSDLFTSRDADDKGNGLELRMKYAYADLYFWRHRHGTGVDPYPLGHV